MCVGRRWRKVSGNQIGCALLQRGRLVLNERHLRRILASYLDYYHGSRRHLSLGKNAPDGWPVFQADAGKVVSLAQGGGLHHRYERLAARTPLGSVRQFSDGDDDVAGIAMNLSAVPSAPRASPTAGQQIRALFRENTLPPSQQKARQRRYRVTPWRSGCDQ